MLLPLLLVAQLMVILDITAVNDKKGVVMNDERYDVVVIGAGQAGLAIGHFLAKQGKRFVILEAADSVGSAWRSRWDSLVLFTPRRYDALPGLAFPGDPDGYPTRDEVVAYLERYAEHFQLPIELSSPVRSLRKDERRLRARRRRAAHPRRPGRRRHGAVSGAERAGLAGGLADEVFQTHSTGYRRPADVPEGRVLVVGGGNTGFQIAKELAGEPRGASRDRLPAEAAAAASARPRPLLVADEARPALEDGRVADRPARAEPRHPDRLEPARRRSATASRCGRAPFAPRAARSASPTAASWRSTP